MQEAAYAKIGHRRQPARLSGLSGDVAEMEDAEKSTLVMSVTKTARQLRFSENSMQVRILPSPFITSPHCKQRGIRPSDIHFAWQNGSKPIRLYKGASYDN